MRKSAVFAFLVVLLTAHLPFAQTIAKPDSKPSSSSTAAVPEVAGLPLAAEQAMAGVDPEKIRAHVKFLADDLLEGRGTGKRGGDIAAQYIATQFELYGLKPAGDNGSYLQRVPMIGIANQKETTLTLEQDHGDLAGLRVGDDFVTSDQTGHTEDNIEAPIVWMGYGIDAPEFDWNDYRDVDVKGKVLLMMVNEPPSNDSKFFAGPAITYYGRWTYKFEEAARKGAVGVLLIHKSDMASYGWEVVRNSWSGERTYLRDNPAPKLKAAAWIQLDVARKIAQASGMELDSMMLAAQKRGFKPVPLHVRLKAHVVSKVRDFESSNVVAKLPGSDPRLEGQAVVYTAHYDHLGVGPAIAGDNIYNGAQDNATGCGIVLEIARAYASATRRPKRSVYFVSVTAEEQGLLGSEYFGKHPPVPAKNLALDLNYDSVPPIGVPQDVNVAGAERTDFYATVERTAKTFHLAIVPDSEPSAGHYYRSDHFSFARAGVPAFSIAEGDRFEGHDRQWGVDQAREYVSQRYHRPADEYRPEMDFRGNAVVARFGIALGWLAADQPQDVRWLPGDEFEKARKTGDAH